MFTRRVMNVLGVAAGKPDTAGVCAADAVLARDVGACDIVPAAKEQHLIFHDGWGSFGVILTPRGRELLAAA